MKTSLEDLNTSDDAAQWKRLEPLGQAKMHGDRTRVKKSEVESERGSTRMWGEESSNSSINTANKCKPINVWMDGWLSVDQVRTGIGFGRKRPNTHSSTITVRGMKY
jgi:hypothetical protein